MATCPLLQECLRDIALALESGYPTSLHYKLHIRRSQCLSKLNRHKEEVEALQSALKCLELVGNMSLQKKCKDYEQKSSRRLHHSCGVRHICKMNLMLSLWNWLDPAGWWIGFCWVVDWILLGGGLDPAGWWIGSSWVVDFSAISCWELFFFIQLHTAALRLIVQSWLDIPTFATRHLHACHHVRAPSGGRWNCGREMSGNFA